MTASDWMNVAALLLSPLIALQVRKKLDESKELGLRRMWVFRTLMATRANRVASEHVNALNSSLSDRCCPARPRCGRTPGPYQADGPTEPGRVAEPDNVPMAPAS